MYYDTPSVGRYVNWLKGYRSLLIPFVFLLALGSFSSINSQLFSSDERVWLQDSLELEKTQSEALESQHVSRINLYWDELDGGAIEKLKALDKELHQYQEISYVSSILSQKHFYNDQEFQDSQLLKVIDTYSLSDEELGEFIQNFSASYSAYIDLKNKSFILYAFTKDSFDLSALSFKYDLTVEQISSADDKWEYLIYFMISAFIIMLLFRLVFKSFAASLTAIVIISLT